MNLVIDEELFPSLRVKIKIGGDYRPIIFATKILEYTLYLLNKIKKRRNFI